MSSGRKVKASHGVLSCVCDYRRESLCGDENKQAAFTLMFSFSVYIYLSVYLFICLFMGVMSVYNFIVDPKKKKIFKQ
jgi:hypothetical protein